MARIKHIAIRTPYPEKTAAFYKDVFGLKEVGQARAGVYLSDGYINLAILKSRAEDTGESPRDAAGYTGIHHLGFMVDDIGSCPLGPQRAGIEAMQRQQIEQADAVFTRLVEAAPQFADGTSARRCATWRRTTPARSPTAARRSRANPNHFGDALGPAPLPSGAQRVPRSRRSVPAHARCPSAPRERPRESGNGVNGW